MGVRLTEENHSKLRLYNFVPFRSRFLNFLDRITIFVVMVVGNGKERYNGNYVNS